jgi:hypothetical protein
MDIPRPQAVCVTPSSYYIIGDGITIFSLLFSVEGSPFEMGKGK